MTAPPPLSVGFAIPGDLETVSGGYAYDRRLIAEAAEASGAGLRLTPIALPGGFPAPSTDDLTAAAAALEAWSGPLLIDGLAYGAFSASLAARVGGRAAALVHHPLCLENGLTPARAAALEASERAALEACRGVLVTSAATGRLVAELFGVAPERIAVAEPGVDRGPRAPVSGHPPTLLAVGALIPRKGYDLLLAALARLTDLDWRLEIVGPTDRDPACRAALEAQRRAAGLDDRAIFLGAVSDAERDAAYARADLFVAPSRFEGYGMAVAEALTRGVPVIAGRGGALADTAASGILVDPEDVSGFAAALRPLILDPAARRRAADRAFAAGQATPRWADTAAAAAAALRRFLG